MLQTHTPTCTHMHKHANTQTRNICSAQYTQATTSSIE